MSQSVSSHRVTPWLWLALLGALGLAGCFSDPDSQLGQKPADTPSSETGDDSGDTDRDLSHLWGGTITDERKTALDRAVLDSPKQPHTGHPRLYGSNAEWTAYFAPLDDLDSDCTLAGGVNGIGNVKNIKAVWESQSRGGVSCEGTVPATPMDHPLARPYVDGSLNTGIRGHYLDRLRVLHLIRRELHCHEQHPGDTGECQFTAADLDTLVQGYVAGEMTRLRNAPRSDKTPDWAGEIGYPPGFSFITWWHRTSEKRFDLGAGKEFKAWTLFLDIFWDHPALGDEDQAWVERELGYEIDSYLMSARKGHWNLANGNNWTVVLNNAALHWAILFYHERPEKARRVLETVLTYNWLHRDYYTEDGAYLEGPSYFSTSFLPILNMQQLLRASFGEILHSFNWFVAGEHTPSWFLDNTAPDGTRVNFGDAWDRIGQLTDYPLVLMLNREVLALDPVGSASPDACLAQRYFMNSYHTSAFEDVWMMEPALARDWAGIAAACDEPGLAGSDARAYPTYGQGLIRSRVPGASAAAASATDSDPYTLQADQTFLTVNTVDNSVNHREIDFGAVIWTAYGNRLLTDFGYGGIARNAFQYDLFHRMNGTFANQVDNTLAANKLIVPSAFVTLPEGWDWERRLYTGEPFGRTGTVGLESIDGTEVVFADGTDLYSGTSPNMGHRPAVTGPLDYFHRWLVPLDGGHFLIVDAFRAKPDHASRIQEFWLTHDDPLYTECHKPLSTSSTDVVVTSPDSSTVVLEPVCAQVPVATASETLGRMKAASLHPGAFAFDIPDFLPTDPEFQADALDLREGVAVLKMTNRVGAEDRRKLFRWVPNEAVREDVRVFLLQAATDTQGGLADASLARVTDGCGTGQVCFDVAVAGQTGRRIVLDNASGRYRLTEL